MDHVKNSAGSDIERDPSRVGRSRTVALIATVLAYLVPALAGAQVYDHQKCYKFKDEKTFRSAKADLDSLRAEFGLENCSIKAKAKQYCVPADKSLTEIIDGVDTPFPADELLFDRICYKIKCPKVEHPPMQISDQFGTRIGEKFKAATLCTPAVLGIPTTTTTTTSTTTTTATTTTTIIVPATFSFGFGNNQDQELLGVALDSAGNVYVAGEFSGTINVGTGPLVSNGAKDAIVIKYNGAGVAQWAATFGNSNADTAIALAIDSGNNVVIVGEVEGTVDFGGGSVAGAGGTDAFVVKLASDGTHQWSARYGDASDQSAFSVAIDSADAVLLDGRFEGSIDLGGGAHASAGDADIFVAKVDSGGAFLWSNAYGDTSFDQAAGIEVDSADNVLVAGGFTGTVDFGGGAIVGAGSLDAFFLKLTSAGAHVWSAAFGDASFQFGYSVQVDSADNLLVSGIFGGAIDLGGGALAAVGNSDGFLAKLSPAGAHVWSQGFGGASASTSGLGIAVDGSDNVTYAGQTDAASIDFGGGALTGAGLNDVFVAKFTSGGAHTSSQLYGDAQAQRAYRVATDAAGNRYLVGAFESAIDFGDGVINSNGAEDAFVAKLAP